MNCPQCGSNHLRTSRIRPSDIPRVFLFQWPVRCRVCRERSYIGFVLALNLKQSEKVRRREERSRKNTTTPI